MIRISVFIFKIIVLLVPFQAFAQNDTIPRPLINGLRLGADVIRIANNFYNPSSSKTFSGFEFTGDLGIKRFFIVADYGKSTIERAELNSIQQYTSGNYYRFGFDYNIFQGKTNKNVFLIGLRYAQSNFKDKVSFVIEDPIWGDSNFPTIDRNNKANWMEFTTGLKVEIWKNIYLGYNFRYKFRLRTKESIEFIAYEVPGYGKAKKEGRAGFNYYIYYRIPLMVK